jgi:hypothetical protein
MKLYNGAVMLDDHLAAMRKAVERAYWHGWGQRDFLSMPHILAELNVLFETIIKEAQES